MANEQNLIPIRTKEEARELGRKGGLVRSKNKKLASKLRELKKKGLTDENVKRIYDIMTDADITDLETLMLIQSLQPNLKTTKEKAEVIRLFLEWRKLRHGSKEKIEHAVDVRNYTFSIELKKLEIVTPEMLEEDGRKAEDSVVTNTETVGSLPDTTGQDNN